MRTLPILLLPLITGCSVIDALQGGGDEPDPCEVRPDLAECQNFQFTCATPLRLGTPEFGPVEVGIDTCGQQPSEAPDECGNPVGFDAVFQLDIEDADDYVICTSGPPNSSFAYTTDCGAPGADACLPAEDCTFLFLPAGRHFFRWRSGDLDSCGFVSIFVERSNDEFGEVGGQCIDGQDNEGNGLTDCEEDSCKFEGLCESFLTAESCNGMDDGDEFGLGFKLIDEAACLCVNDEGCDHIDLDSPFPYACHVNFNPNGDAGLGVCAPRCDNGFNWCEPFGAICVNGFCQF